MSNTVQATPDELQQCIDHLNACLATIRAILDRPAPPSRGRIEFEDAVIELPDEGPYDPRD